jgi:hypothetical protein
LCRVDYLVVGGGRLVVHTTSTVGYALGRRGADGAGGLSKHGYGSWWWGSGLKLLVVLLAHVAVRVAVVGRCSATRSGKAVRLQKACNGGGAGGGSVGTNSGVLVVGWR